MKILCHVGPWCRDHFEVIAASFCASADIRFVSGFKQLDQTGLVDAYYGYVGESRGIAPAVHPDDVDVVRRCRLLRTLDEPTAHAHVGAMRRAVREMLHREKPDVIICESIDQYLHDLLFREAAALGIPAYGLIRSFVNGYFRVSERGEYVAVRSPHDEEVRAVLAKLIAADYLPQNLFALKRYPRLTYLRIQLSNLLRVVYFAAFRRVAAEPYNYHYWASARGTRVYSTHLMPQASLGDRAWQQRISQTGKPVVYVPLQHYPEATIDYWCDDVALVDYPAALVRILAHLRHDFHFLVKEHPGVWGFRKPSFYRDLARLESVTICPTNVLSQDCIASSDAVLVWTGSAGFEAGLRGKPVLTTCVPYYSSGNRFMKIGLEPSAGDVVRFVKRCQTTPMTESDRLELVRHILAGAFPGRFQNDGSFRKERPADVADAQHVGRCLADLYHARSMTQRAPADSHRA
jgi:hypothetical protein